MPTPPEEAGDPAGDPTAPDTRRDPSALPELLSADYLDIVAGDPPVPIIVWRVGRSGLTAAALDAAADGLTPRLAALLVGLYSRVGDTVVDLTTDPGIAGAAGAGGRRYLPVTDPAGLHDLDHLSGAVGLLVLRWPPTGGDQTSASTPSRLADLFTACRRLLATDGHTVVALVPPSAQTTYLDHARLLVPAAHRAGLGYLQHILAITTPIHSLTSPDHNTPDDTATARATSQRRGHIDLLVLVIHGHRHD